MSTTLHLPQTALRDPPPNLRKLSRARRPTADRYRPKLDPPQAQNTPKEGNLLSRKRRILDHRAIWSHRHRFNTVLTRRFHRRQKCITKKSSRILGVHKVKKFRRTSTCTILRLPHHQRKLPQRRSSRRSSSAKKVAPRFQKSRIHRTINKISKNSINTYNLSIILHQSYRRSQN